MKTISKLSLALGAMLWCGSVLADVSPCGPGGGGTPMVDISGHVSQTTRLLRTHTGVQDFQLWESAQKIVYRDGANQLESYDLAAGTNEVLGAAKGALARIVDPGNRFLLGDSTWIFDAVTRAWTSYAPANAGLTPMFWNDAVLYSARQIPLPDGESQLEIYRYEPQSGTTLQCRTLPFEIPDAGTMHIAQGAHYPNLYLYYQEATDRGWDLVLTKLDVRNCAPLVTTPYPYVFYGPIESVHIFEPLRSFLVKVNHPTYNLLWHSDRAHSCRYYNLDNLPPFVLSEEQPIVATYSREHGLTLANLDEQTRGTYLSDLNIGPVTEGNLSLTSDGSMLYVAPQIPQVGTRLLFEVKVK